MNILSVEIKLLLAILLVACGRGVSSMSVPRDLPVSRREIFSSSGFLMAGLPVTANDEMGSPGGKVRLYICRHGETEFNRLGLAQGRRIDAPLNPTGDKQAARLAHFLAKKLNTQTRRPVVYSSTLLRARQTADAVSEVASGQRIMLPDLDEIDFGDLEGGRGPKEKLVGETLKAWALGDLSARVGNTGESGAEVIDRINAALEQISRCDADAVCVVTHSSYLRVALSVATGLPLVLTLGLDQRNCCVNVLELSRKLDRPAQLITVNQVSHLGDLVWHRYSTPVTCVQRGTAALDIAISQFKMRA